MSRFYYIVIIGQFILLRNVFKELLICNAKLLLTNYLEAEIITET